MYPHEPVTFDSIHAKDTEELELLPELSTTSPSNVRPFHWHLFIHTSEDLVQSWKSQKWSPSALDCHNTANFTKPRAINARWGYAPRKGMGFVFICQCSSLTQFPPADMQTGLSRTAHAADERKFVCGDYETDKWTSSMALASQEDPPFYLHRKCPITQAFRGCCHNTCKEV